MPESGTLLELPEFRFDPAELSGALADLGVMLPLVLALITLNGINASSAFVVIAAAYFLNAFVYRLPVPVQPLKALAASALALGVTPGVIAASSWWIAAIFTLLAATGAVTWVGKLFPSPVVRGIQIGLGLLLLRSAWNLVAVAPDGWGGGLSIASLNFPWLWVVTLLAAGALAAGLLWKPAWAGILVIVGGLLIGLIHLGIPTLRIIFTLPTFSAPGIKDFGPAFILLVLPQVPLSLANSVFATADAARQYFGPRGERVSPRRLLLTMGTANVAAAALGGVPVCHGSGGLTAHYRLGARTGGALLFIGAIFLILGLLGGEGLLSLLRLIPFPALGILLAYVGVQHMLLAKDLSGSRAWSVALLVAFLSWITQNLAIGFLGGILLFATWGLVEHFARPGEARLKNGNF